MQFSDIIGQDHVKQLLARQLEEDRVPHAQLFCGPEGSGKLPMALAMATALLCRNRSSIAPCGTCNDCKMMEHFAHPDLHFVMPSTKAKEQETGLSLKYLSDFRAQLNENVWFSNMEWLQRIGLEKKNPLIYESQCDDLVQEISLVAQKPGGYKVVIIWQADRMNADFANKLLKTLEEPTPRTVIILTTDKPELLLDTIKSRCQTIVFPPLQQGALEEMLIQHNGLSAADARMVAHASQGSYTRALSHICADHENSEFFDIFVETMRLCYMRKVKELNEMAENLSRWNRPKAIRYLQYCQHLVRENFIYNLGISELNYQSQKEAAFSKNFARFINERNVEDITRELSDAERDIERNISARMVFFDLHLKLIVLILR